MFNKLNIFQFSHYLALLFLSIIELGFCRSIGGYAEGINVDTTGDSDDDTDYRDYSPDITYEASVHNDAGEIERLPTAEARRGGGGGRGGGGRGFRGGGGRRGRKWGSRGGGGSGLDGDQEDSESFYIILLILYIILSCCSCMCPTEPAPAPPLSDN